MYSNITCTQISNVTITWLEKKYYHFSSIFLEKVRYHISAPHLQRSRENFAQLVILEYYSV